MGGGSKRNRWICLLGRQEGSRSESPPWKARFTRGCSLGPPDTAQPLSRLGGPALTCSCDPLLASLLPPGSASPPGALDKHTPSSIRLSAFAYVLPTPNALCPPSPQGACPLHVGPNAKARAFQSLGQGREAALDPRACACAARRGRQVVAAIGPFPRPGGSMSPQQGPGPGDSARGHGAMCRDVLRRCSWDVLSRGQGRPGQPRGTEILPQSQQCRGWETPLHRQKVGLRTGVQGLPGRVRVSVRGSSCAGASFSPRGPIPRTEGLSPLWLNQGQTFLPTAGLQGAWHAARSSC